MARQIFAQQMSARESREWNDWAKSIAAAAAKHQTKALSDAIVDKFWPRIVELEAKVAEQAKAIERLQGVSIAPVEWPLRAIEGGKR